MFDPCASKKSIGLAARKAEARVSRPFIVAAVLLVFAGSLIGSVWMTSIFTQAAHPFYRAFQFHMLLQIDGFLTMLIMGVGYMIVPRFRNTVLPSSGLAVASFLLVLLSIALHIAGVQEAPFVRIAGVFIFAGLLLWMLRVAPKLLRLSDYFTGLSAVLLAVLSVVRLPIFAGEGYSLSEAQLLLLFPILMIFGVEYKTLPSFLGFIRPMKKTAAMSFGLAAATAFLGITSILVDNSIADFGFNLAFLASAALLAISLYIFGGFDNSEIKNLISGEKKARYAYTLWYIRIAFLLLFASIGFALGFHTLPDGMSYLFMDLGVHYAAIGFLGVTISLYLPLMLPPIIDKQIHFARFNHLPVILIITSLALRSVGDFFIVTGDLQSPLSLAFASSGWLVVAALGAFVAMLHRSMQQAVASY